MDELRRTVTAELLQDASVVDCFVTVRAQTTPHAVAYVVADERTPTEDLVRRLQSAPELAAVRVGIVRVPGLPFADDGRVDASTLEALVDSGRLDELTETVRGAHASARLTIVTKPAWHRRRERSATEQARARYGSGQPSIIERAGVDRPDFSRTLPVALRRAAERAPDRGITLIGSNGRSSFLSYPELLRRARIGAGSLARSVEVGAPVVLQFSTDEQLFVAYWTAALAGAVPVIVPAPEDYRQPSTSLERLSATLKCLGSPAILTTRGRQPELAAFDPAARALALEELDNGEPSDREPRTSDPAVMQLSSGSTGVSKCIVLSHENVMTTVLGNIVDLNNHEDDVILTWAPMDHVGSLIHVIRAICLGSNAVVVRPEYIVGDPLRWLELMAIHRATNTWAPSFAYKLVVERLRATGAEPRSWDLRGVRVMINAGEQVAVSVAREFCETLAIYGFDPHALIPAFGMAELGSGVTHSHRFDPAHDRGTYRLDRGAVAAGHAGPARPDDDNPLTLCGLGGPIPGAAMRVVDAGGEVLPEGTIGRVQFAGKNVMQGYFRNPTATAAVFQPGGWFDSGDLGFLDGGELVITGREKEIVIVRGNNLLCHDIETAATVAGVLSTWVAAVGVKTRDAEEALAIFFVPDPSAPDEHATAGRIREAVARQLGITPDAIVPLAHVEFPRTDSGKIQRRQLASWFESGRFGELATTSPSAAAPPSLFVRTEWLLDATDRPALPPERRFLLVGRDAAQLDAASTELRRLGHVVRAERLGDAAAAPVLMDGDVDEIVLFDAPPSPATADLAELHAFAAGPVLGVVRALARSSAKPERVTVVTRACFRVDPGERPFLGAAILPGLLRSAARELGSVVRQVDLPADDVPAPRLANELVTRDRHVEVCLRSGGRLLRRYSYCEPLPDGTSDRPAGFAPGSHCIVAGGLGGVGFVLSRWLLARHGARVLVVGRTPVDQLDAVRAERLRSLQQLGDVEYAAVDVALPSDLAAAARRTEERWGSPVQWIFQLAARATDLRIPELSLDDLARDLRPKVSGALALHTLIDARPGATLVLFSSVVGAFGAALNPAYAAACSFEELFAAGSAGRVRCIAWSMWDKIGMSGERSLAAAPPGYVALTADAALTALDATLRAGSDALLIGIDLAAGSLGVVARSHGFEQYLEIATPDPDAVQSLRARASAQLGLRVVVRQVPIQPPPTSTNEAEASALEAQLIELWSEVLGVPVPRDRTFFELGGNSLRAMLLTELISRAFDVELPANILTTHATVPELAGYIERAPRSG